MPSMFPNIFSFSKSFPPMTSGMSLTCDNQGIEEKAGLGLASPDDSLCDLGSIHSSPNPQLSHRWKGMIIPVSATCGGAVGVTVKENVWTGGSQGSSQQGDWESSISYLQMRIGVSLLLSWPLQFLILGHLTFLIWEDSVIYFCNSTKYCLCMN